MTDVGLGEDQSRREGFVASLVPDSCNWRSVWESGVPSGQWDDDRVQGLSEGIECVHFVEGEERNGRGH